MQAHGWYKIKMDIVDQFTQDRTTLFRVNLEAKLHFTLDFGL